MLQSWLNMNEQIPMESIIESLFALGMFINGTLFIPQAIKIFRLKEARDLSLLTFFGFNFIQAVTILHGIIKQDFALAIGMSYSFITCAMVTLLIIKYRR